jgi:hypothetical protein
MKKASRARRAAKGDLRAEYDFDYSKARPNRFAGRIAQNRVVVLDSDIADVFKTGEDVNRVLRALITNMPKPVRVAGTRRTRLAGQ